MLALTTAALSFNVAVRPSLAVSRVAQPKMGLVADIKDAVLPSNTDSTLRNVMGYQMTGWGVGSTVCPALMMNTLFAANPTGATVWMMRAMGLGMLSLGAKTCGGSDADAATTGLIFYGAWYKVLTAAAVVSGTGKAAAATLGGYVTMIATWNLLCALSCARRSGGLFKRVTELDLGVVDSVLPKDTKVSTRNIVGANVAAWGLICWKFQDFFLGSRIVAGGATPLMTSVILPGIALANLLLAGKIFAGSDKDAATNGAVILGGYGVIGYLAAKAGVFAGTWMGWLPLVNFALAAYCVKELL